MFTDIANEPIRQNYILINLEIYPVMSLKDNIGTVYCTLFFALGECFPIFQGKCYFKKC